MEIQERRSGSISGWVGVLVVALCAVAAVLLVRTAVPGLVAVPAVVGVLALTSSVVVQPGQTRAVQFFGR